MGKRKRLAYMGNTESVVEHEKCMLHFTREEGYHVLTTTEWQAAVHAIQKFSSEYSWHAFPVEFSKNTRLHWGPRPKPRPAHCDADGRPQELLRVPHSRPTHFLFKRSDTAASHVHQDDVHLHMDEMAREFGAVSYRTGTIHYPDGTGTHSKHSLRILIKVTTLDRDPRYVIMRERDNQFLYHRSAMEPIVMAHLQTAWPQRSASTYPAEVLLASFVHAEEGGSGDVYRMITVTTNLANRSEVRESVEMQGVNSTVDLRDYVRETVDLVDVAAKEYSIRIYGRTPSTAVFDEDRRMVIQFDLGNDATVGSDVAKCTFTTLSTDEEPEDVRADVLRGLWPYVFNVLGVGVSVTGDERGRRRATAASSIEKAIRQLLGTTNGGRLRLITDDDALEYLSGKVYK